MTLMTVESLWIPVCETWRQRETSKWKGVVGVDAGLSVAVPMRKTVTGCWRKRMTRSLIMCNLHEILLGRSYQGDLDGLYLHRSYTRNK
jgi:hypothetical protein